MFAQVDLGVLTGCFHIQDKGTSYCIVQLYEPMDVSGAPLCNEFDCPLFSLTNLFRCVPSTSIFQSVSIIHQCTSTCMCKLLSDTTQIERQTVTKQMLTFVHDFCNHLYCFNIYCMHSSSKF